MTGTHTGKIVMWTKAEIWSHAPTSQKHQRVRKTTRSSEEARKGCALEISGRAWSCWHPEFKLPVSKTLRKYICVVSRYPVCGNLLQQPRESNSHDPPAYKNTPLEMFLQGHLANVLVPNFPNLLSLNLCGWCLGISVVTNSFLEMFIWTRV